MNSTAKARKNWDEPKASALRPSSRDSLRLVRNTAIPLTEKALRPKQPAAEGDPLEEPVQNFCGLCGNKIEAEPVSEHRASGCNMKPQIWHYHEVCYKQLQRMRRFEDNCWAEKKPANPEIRYSAAEAVGEHRSNSIIS